VPLTYRKRFGDRITIEALTVAEALTKVDQAGADVLK
jgi:hypothetical protein